MFFFVPFGKVVVAVVAVVAVVDAADVALLASGLKMIRDVSILSLFCTHIRWNTLLIIQ